MKKCEVRECNNDATEFFKLSGVVDNLNSTSKVVIKKVYLCRSCAKSLTGPINISMKSIELKKKGK